MLYLPTVSVIVDIDIDVGEGIPSYIDLYSFSNLTAAFIHFCFFNPH